MGTELQFHSWRVFVIIAALPAVTSLVGLTFMPESPRFLLEVRPRGCTCWELIMYMTLLQLLPSGSFDGCCFNRSCIKTLKVVFNECFYGFCEEFLLGFNVISSTVHKEFAFFCLLLDFIPTDVCC